MGLTISEDSSPWPSRQQTGTAWGQQLITHIPTCKQQAEKELTRKCSQWHTSSYPSKQVHQLRTKYSNTWSYFLCNPQFPFHAPPSCKDQTSSTYFITKLQPSLSTIRFLWFLLICCLEWAGAEVDFQLLMVLSSPLPECWY